MKHCVLLLFTCLFLNITAFAQPAPALETEQLQRRIQQDTQQLLRERDIQTQERSISQPTISDTPADGLPSAEEACFNITAIKIDGPKKIDINRITAKVREIAKPCLTKTLLAQIQNSVQQMYLDKGYVSSRVYFDFKEISSGTLKIIISEGILEDIILLDPKTKQPQEGLSAKLKIATAFPFQRGHILNLRSLEQGIEQLNRLASNQATMQIAPGKKEGGSVVIIDSPPLPENNLTLSYDNSGAESTGLNRLNAAFSRDNLLSLNDNIYVNAASTVGDGAAKYSRSLTGVLSVPFGGLTLSNTTSYSKYLSSAQGYFSVIESNGNTLTNISALDYVINRAAHHKLSLGAQLTYKQSKNYVEDIYIDASSRILTVGSIYLTGTYYSPLGSFYSKLSLNNGLHLFGSKIDGNHDSGVPQAQFTSMGLYLNYSHNLWRFNYNASVDTQYSFDDLFASEQMMIGAGAVRGFKENTAYGDSGIIIRQDLSCVLINMFGRSGIAFIDGALSHISTGVFADFGVVYPKTYGNSTTLAGAGAKINYFAKYLTAQLAWEHSVYTPNEVKGEGSIFRINAALNLAF